MVPIKNALILAAGRGRRLLPYTKDRPKCLVEVGGKPILYYQLRALEINALKNIVVVVGYRAAMVEEYVKKNFSNLDVKFILNDKYETTGPAHSLLLAKRVIRGRTLQFMGDVLFHPRTIPILPLKSNGKSITCLRRGFCGEEEMKAEVKGDIVCSLDKKLSPDKTAGEFVGVSLFADDFLKSLFEVLAESIKKGGSSIYYVGDAIRKTIQEKQGKLGFFYADEVIMEIDFPKDIKFAEANIVPIISRYLA